jgi:tetratricopeptide (TPR) repeat protein
MNLEETLKRAVYLARSGDADRAIPLFVRLVEKRPENVQLRIYLAKALGLAFRFEERDLLIENLLTASGREPSVLVSLAKTWEELDRPDAALALWEEAAQSGKIAGSWSHVARLAERLNQLERAKEALRQVEKEEERGPGWFWVEARLRARAGDHAKAADLFEALKVRAKAGDWWRRAGHGLASAWDALGEYARAWQCLHEVKQAQVAEAEKLARATPLPQAVAVPVSGKRSPVADDEKELPLTLLTGFPRSGTTLAMNLLSRASGQRVSDESLAMERMLRAVRAGRSPRAKARELPSARESYLQANEALLGPDFRASPFIDKNPAMALWVPWVRLILPEVRVLWVRRDWREVALSCWFTDFPLNGFTARFATLESLRKVLELAESHRSFLQDTLHPSHYHEVHYGEIVTSGALPEAAVDFVRTGRKVAETWKEGRPAFVNSPTYSEVQKAPSDQRLGRWKGYREQAPEFFERLGVLEESTP